MQKKYAKLWGLFLLLIIGPAWVSGQEFNCQVQVSARQIEGTNRTAFEALQTALYEFVNARKWTSYTYRPEERIEATILLTINERLSTDTYSGQLNLILKRPIFKSNYNSTLLNYIDKDISFTYVENQPLEYNDNSFDNNLTSIIAFYLNIFLGLDADSFTPSGGSFYFQRAQSIVQSAQGANEIGWKAYESLKNRYWLSENLNNPLYQSLRTSMYQYHRKGLDVMYDNTEMGRASIVESIKLWQQLNKQKPGSFLLQLILEAKRDELIQIFSEGTGTTKTTVTEILQEIDPANGSKYQKILSR